MGKELIGVRLIDKILSNNGIVGVIGLGYVGLPLAVEIARSGFQVRGFDILPEKVNMINEGENYIGDVRSEDLAKLVHAGNLTASTDFQGIEHCDVVALCVPTPLDEYKQTDLSFVIQAAEKVAEYLHREMLVILESTTFPGTTEEVILPILEESGLKCGKDFFLAFSPERVDPGNKTFKTTNTPKIVGGCTAECTEVAKVFYESFLAARIYPVSSPKEAEMTKIYENTFRIVNCALANEMSIICHKMGINIWEVIDAAATKPFGFMPFYPGPGVGGHCIPIDPYYLTHRARRFDYHTRLIELAGDINDEMPGHVVSRIQDLLNEKGLALKGSKILLLGVAYKSDIEDLRESPALKVWSLLEAKGAKVVYHDPYCSKVKRGRHYVPSRVLSPDLIQSMDIVIITTGHKKSVDYQLAAANARILLDTKNIVKTFVDVGEYNNVYIL